MHTSCKANHYIINSKSNNFEEEHLKFSTSFEFENTFKKFTTPDEFNINYKYYFKNDYVYSQGKEFYIYNDNKDGRSCLMWDFKYGKYPNDIILFYGNSGIGKSITLISTLKFNYSHKEIGTFLYKL